MSIAFDPILVVSAASIVPAIVGVIYTQRTVREMRRQNDAKQRAQAYVTSHQLTMELQDSRDEVGAALRALMEDRAFREAHLQTSDPAYVELLSLFEIDIEFVFKMRGLFEGLQESYIARKHDFVTDEHWSSIRNIAMSTLYNPRNRRAFHLHVDLEWVTPEFGAYVLDLMRTGTWVDPLGRLEDIVGDAFEP